MRIFILFVFLFGSASFAKADALNEKRILRKAGGESKGTINLDVTTTPYSMGVPGMSTTQPTQKRSGDAMIPTKEGKAKSLIVHLGQPGPTNDTVSRGRVKKADVSRSGKVIKYAGVGTGQPVFDNDGDYYGSGKGTSKIRGSKVITTGTFKGKRTLRDMMTTEILEVKTVKGTAEGKSKF